MPGAAASNAFCARLRPTGIVHRRMGVIVGAVPIGAPFPHVAVHVAQPETIRRELPDGHSELRRPVLGKVELLHVGKRRAVFIVADVGHSSELSWVIPVVVSRRRAGAAGVLPLGLGRQAIRLSFFARKPLAEGRRVVPGDVEHRLIVGLLEAGISPVELHVAAATLAPRGVVTPAAEAVLLGFSLVAGFVGEAAELADGHFIFAQLKGFRDPHAMARVFVLEEIRRAVVRGKGFDQFLGRFLATHHELARRHQNHLHADGIGGLGWAGSRPIGSHGQADSHAAGDQDKCEPS